MNLHKLMDELRRHGVKVEDVTGIIGDMAVTEITADESGVTIRVQPPVDIVGTVTEEEQQQAEDHCAGWRCGQCPLTMSAEEAADAGGE